MRYTLEILISKEEIDDRINIIAAEINEHYKDSKSILLVGLLRGGAIFLADLARQLTGPVALDFMATSIYGGDTKSCGEVRILKELDEEIHGRDVLIVEDIIDTGNTLNKIREILLLRNPKSLAICTLLNKTARRQVDVKVDWQGFSVEDKFVVGYGIDFDQLYRNLPYIATVNFNQ